VIHVFCVFFKKLVFMCISLARRQVDAWLLKSASVAFRVRTKTRHGATMAFVGNKAIVNRTKFRNQLVSVQRALGVEAAAGGYRWAEELQGVVAGFHKPCMRLELTQHVLGLDGRWERDALIATLGLLRGLLRSQAQNQIKY
jgi:hypothetical protein